MTNPILRLARVIKNPYIGKTYPVIPGNGTHVAKHWYILTNEKENFEN